MKARIFTLCLGLFAASVFAARADDASAVLEFKARDAKIGGDGKAAYEDGPGQDNIGRWNSTNTTVTWKFDLPQRGTFRVLAVYSCAAEAAGTEFEVTVGGQRANGVTASTGGWKSFAEIDLGPVILRKRIAAAVGGANARFHQS